ncbi:MAG: putative metal-binding motif-containing protein [Deltaproteobacteria bacterium]|nr:putative metal-binding motif-containing protein [Deltaproteobacteria bacterium]
MKRFSFGLVALAALLVGCGEKESPVDSGVDDTDDTDDTDTPEDVDGDGYIAASDGGDDCDDHDATVHPDAGELCDGVDNDCDDLIDNDPVNGGDFFFDSDGDTYGDAAQTVSACAAPAGYVERSGDCDDTDASFNPGATELCDGVDNDCDGQLDEGCGGDTDADGDGFIAEADGGDDCNDGDAAINPDATETCDTVDNNCDGTVDEGCSAPVEVCGDGIDNDGDGQPDCEDADCFGDASCTESLCGDTVDNDNDGLADCDDDDCWGTPECFVPGSARSYVTGGSVFTERDWESSWGSWSSEINTFYTGSASDVTGVVQVLPASMDWPSAVAGDWVSCDFGYGSALFSHSNLSSYGYSWNRVADVMRSGFWIASDCPIQSSAFLPRMLMAGGGGGLSAPAWYVAESHYSSWRSSTTFSRGPLWFDGNDASHDSSSGAMSSSSWSGNQWKHDEWLVDPLYQGSTYYAESSSAH